MKKTKFLAFALAAVMSLSMFAGCGEKDNTEVVDTIKETEVQTVEETVAETEVKTVAETTAETVEVVEDVSIVGTFDGTTYVNPYIGIAIDFDSSWTFSDAATIQETYLSTIGIIEDSSYGQYLEGLEQFYDFMATANDGMSSMNLIYQKYTPETELLYTTLSVEEIIDTMISTQKDALTEVYTSMGAENVTLEKAYTTLINENYPVLKTIYTIQGLSVYTTQIIVPCDTHSATITLASYGADTTDALAAMISPFYVAE